jgi:S1-C subfamily serine protease
MKSQSLVFALVLFLVVAACFAQKPGKKPTAPSAENTAVLPFDLARKVTMAVMERTQYDMVPLGSAVWIGKKGYLATCEHVVRNVSFPLKVGMAYDPYVATGNVTVVISRAMNVTDATVAASDSATDVAILKASQTPGQFFGQLVSGTATTISAAGAVLRSEFPAHGATLLLSGYPLDGHTLILQVASATGEALSDQLTPESIRMMLSVVSNPGNSGGPVLDSSGAVVGLLEGNRPSPIRDANHNLIYVPVASVDPATGKPAHDANGNTLYEREPILLMQNSGISVAVPAKYIVKLAKEKNIDWE